MNKYNARKTEVDGKIFDSQKEANRYVELKLMERAGLIKDLKLQQKFCIIPTIEGKTGKIRQRATYYIADFVYFERDGKYWKMVVEDVKSPATKTAAYKIKKKLLLWRWGIEIREV